jgi:hypothetical protein
LSNLFENRPIDEDTQITSSKLVKFNERDACLEDWKWDGIKGSTAILLASQFENLSDEEIAAFLADHIALGGDYTISRRGPEYIFVNYGFQT